LGEVLPKILVISNKLPLDQRRELLQKGGETIGGTTPPQRGSDVQRRLTAGVVDKGRKSGRRNPKIKQAGGDNREGPQSIHGQTVASKLGQTTKCFNDGTINQVEKSRKSPGNTPFICSNIHIN